MNIMEADKPFEGFKPDLFPRLRKLAHFLFDHITDPGLSSHGGGPMLDRELYDLPTHGFLYDGEEQFEQQRIDYGEQPLA